MIYHLWLKNIFLNFKSKRQSNAVLLSLSFLLCSQFAYSTPAVRNSCSSGSLVKLSGSNGQYSFNGCVTCSPSLPRVGSTSYIQSAKKCCSNSGLTFQTSGSIKSGYCQ
jgi:hypothetical protein